MLGPNTVLQGRYRIIRHLGHGGMGSVYEALNERVSSVVALKETFAETDAQREAFEQEAKRLANLDHDAFPRVMDHFFEGEGQYLVMELVRGNDLAELLKLREGPFPPAKVLEWADQLLDALEELHSYPIIHRDIKPANLKLTRKGKIKLLDFGIAKGTVGQMTTLKTDQSGGGYTPHYAPLEQTLRSSGQWYETLSVVDGEAVLRIVEKSTDPRSDLYALGATLYHLMTGRVPPDAPARALSVWSGRRDLLRPAHELNPQVPPAVSAVLMQAMALERDERPASAAELRCMLREAAGEPLSVPPTDLAAEIEEQARQRREEREARRRAEEEEQARLRAEAEAQAKREAEEAARRAEEEARLRREAEERERREEEERQREAERAEAARLAEEERQRRLKQEEERRLALAEAARREAEERQRIAAEQRRKEAEEERRQEAEEKQRREAEEAARLRAEEERAKLEAAEVERRRAAESEVPQRTEPAVEQPAPRDTLKIKTNPTPGLASSPRDRRASRRPVKAFSPLTGRNWRIAVTIIVAGVLVVAFSTIMWLRLTPDVGQEPTTQNVAPAQNTPPSSLGAPQAPAGMVYVPGGEFMMGRDDGDEYERPTHKVTVKPFYIDAYEVTNEEYAKFIQATDWLPPLGWKDETYPTGAGRRPVTGVTWDDANAYAKWAGKRLPTEEEWEFAARGTDGRRYAWGDTWGKGLANANGASRVSAEVGSFAGASPFGAYDMIGNVWEWTASDLKAYPGGQLPETPPGETKVIRGGNFLSSDQQATTTYRMGLLRTDDPSRYTTTGFRCAKDVN
jgi:formylglycine-generating enzyme required for sulfatase activity